VRSIGDVKESFPKLNPQNHYFQNPTLYSKQNKHMTSAPYITVSLVSDRQSLLTGMKARQLGFDSYWFDRLDMFWITLHANDQSVDFCVDPEKDGRFTLSKQSGDITGMDCYGVASELFKERPAYHQMCQWYQNLVDGGYFEDGRYPGKNAAPCPVCKNQFKCGTTHEHVRYCDRIIPHNGRQYKKIVDAGLSVSWRPGMGVNDPSIEDTASVEDTASIGDTVS
jgi:hypothetical protein